MPCMRQAIIQASLPRAGILNMKTTSVRFCRNYIVNVQRSEAKSILYKEMRTHKVDVLCKLNRQLVRQICTKAV